MFKMQRKKIVHFLQEKKNQALNQKTLCNPFKCPPTSKENKTGNIIIIYHICQTYLYFGAFFKDMTINLARTKISMYYCPYTGLQQGKT